MKKLSKRTYQTFAYIMDYDHPYVTVDHTHLTIKQLTWIPLWDKLTQDIFVKTIEK